MKEIVASRWLFLGLVLASTATATSRLWVVLRVDGVSWAETVFLFLFAVLFAWISTSFWMAVLGTVMRLRRGPVGTLIRESAAEASERPSQSRTAIVVPVYNEEVRRLFAGLRAMRASLAQTGGVDGFDVFILSDSNDPHQRAAEQAEWRRWRAAHDEPGAGIYYRNREHNTGRKSGNIADFCRNWGSLYDYMIVLDADSLMTAETMLALVGLMDRNPRAAVIQAPAELVGRDLLFARLQQFASSVYGPLYATGLARLMGPDGNYWGHNAIIRVRPFMHHCGLPRLPGRPPLGGEILSHDFVEAALLRRAGWELHLAPDLGGSYEEPPPTILDYLKRDRRWCQGNLQHARLILAQGLHHTSRLHLLLGVMSYLSSPLWLLMLIASAISAYQSPQTMQFSYVGRYPVLDWPVPHLVDLVALIVVVIAMLYGPKLMALMVLIRDRAMCAQHGGSGRIALSLLLESVCSTLFAPIFMLSHCVFAVCILTGSTTAWLGQHRSEHALPWRAVVAAFAPHTAAAVIAGTAIAIFIPQSFWWFFPLLLGAGLSIPLAIAASSRSLGQRLRRAGLLLVPSETGAVPIVAQVRRAVGQEDAALPAEPATAAPAPR